jgi:hypothetical protein
MKTVGGRRARIPCLILFFSLMLLCVGAATAGVDFDQNSLLRWKTIVGLAQPDNEVRGVAGASQPWSVLAGEAVVNLRNARMEFEVRGLVLAGGSDIGSTGSVDEIKGTLLCGSTAIDTPAVPLSSDGNAHFRGRVAELDTLTSCSNPAYLIRVAAGLNAGFWIANGAVLMH